MWRAASGLSLGTVLVLGCGGGALDGTGGTAAIAKHAVGIDELCEGFPGLTGRAILDRRADRFTGTLALDDRDGTRVASPALTIDLTWPASPTAICYEPVRGQGFDVGPRVAIEGLTMRFVTADGQFDETLAAKAWLPTAFDTIVYPIVMAVTARASLQGSWQPLPGFDGDTVDFVVHLGVPDSTSYDGTVGLGTDIAAALDAAIFAERAMVGVWWSSSSER